MKSGLFSFILISCGMCGWAQTPPPTSPSPASAPQNAGVPGAPGQLKLRGPEAIAAQNPQRVVASIDGKDITAQQAVEMLKPVRPEDRKRFANNMSILLQQVYMQKEFADAAISLKLDEKAPYKQQMEIARENILAQAYVSYLGNQPGQITEDPQKYYDSHPAEFDQVKVSGILITFAPPSSSSVPTVGAPKVRTEEEAKKKADEVAQKLKGGADFAELAKTESDNKTSAPHGGEIGTFKGSDNNLPPDVKTAIFKLQAGQVSDPVRLPNGFYILKVTERSKEPFSQAQGELIQKWQSDKGQAAIKQQVDKYKIDVKDKEFFDMGSATPPKNPSPANPQGATAPPPTPKQ